MAFLGRHFLVKQPFVCRNTLHVNRLVHVIENIHDINQSVVF